MTTLGRDWKARMAARFRGRLAAGSFTRTTVTGPDPADPAGPPLSSVATYTCDLIAFGYRQRYIDGELIQKGDYRVQILRGTVELAGVAVDFMPRSGDTVSCPPPGSNTPIDGRVVDVGPITEAFVTCQVRGAGV